MSNEILVYKNRYNVVTVDLGYDVTGETLTSEIRSEPSVDSVLIATWNVIVDDAATGQLTLTLDTIATAQIKASSGFMDVKRTDGVEAVPAWEKPIEVSFQGSVTL